MDRRETIKSLLIGGLAGGLTLSGCAPGESTENTQVVPDNTGGYGRTDREKKIDDKINSEQFFTVEEAATLGVLVDIILPANSNAGSATEAGVPDFIEFMVKDLPRHQLPLRGGLMWLDNHSNRLYNTVFRDCTGQQQIAICDQIAYPDKAEASVSQGLRFFSLLRDLTLTGYYTTRMGINDLGYKGNQPNVWDGVPDEVLKKHGLEYDPEWISKCVDQSKRMDIAQWDDDGNLLT